MKRKKFTEQEKEILLENEYVITVSERNIKYNPKFKLRAVQEYYAGDTPLIIFLNAKFNIALIGRETPQRCLKRWKNLYKKLGEKGLLDDKRGKSKNGGRPRTKELTLEEEVKTLKSRNAYLEAENDFLKKLKALEVEEM